MQKMWGVLFGVVMFLAFAMFAIAPLMPGWWLPKNVSTFGSQIDNLYYLILAITGFFFVLTEALLVYAMIKYAGTPERRPVPYVHGNHQLELIWTLIPGAILLFLALWQINVWAEVKYSKNMPAPDGTTQQMVVSARQWEWRVRYPSPERIDSWSRTGGSEQAAAYAQQVNNPRQDVRFDDDIHVPNEIHVWKGNKVLVHLRTQDVLHSFFMPNVRIKQDALPGKVIPVWFDAEEANTHKVGDRWLDGYRQEGDQWVNDPEYVWELACAEFCGDRHTYMRGKLYVHPTKEDFLAWLKQAQEQQQAQQPAR